MGSKVKSFLLMVLVAIWVSTVNFAIFADETALATRPETPSIEGTIIPGETQVLEVVGEIRTYTGTFTDVADEFLIQIPILNVGDTIFAHAEGNSFVDTHLRIFDDTMQNIFAEDDNSGLGYDSALRYHVEADRSYTISLRNLGSTGEFTLSIGVNTPKILEEIQILPEGITIDFEPFDCDDADESFRPILSGRERTREEPAFVIHYTRTGVDAATEEWIDELVIALQRSLDVQLNVLGWALPPTDCGEGGDERLDVYVMDIEFTFASGIATPENIVGDNTNTFVTEYYSSYSFLRIDNDMSFIEDEDDALNLMRTTAAHEIHHNIQFGYDVSERFFGYYEAGATWIETLVFPEISSAGSDIAPVFNTPDACYGSYAGSGSGDLRPYGEWLVIDSFTRDLGLYSYQFVWEYLAANEGLNAFYNAVAHLNTTPQEIILRSAVRNLLLDYQLAESFTTTVRIETTMDDFGLVVPSRNGVQQMSVDYIQITEQGVYTFDLLDGDDLELYLVGIDMDEDIARLYELGNGASVDTTSYTHAYMIVLNTAQHLDTDICVYTNWIVQVTDGSGANLIEPTHEIWNATNFVEEINN